MAVVAISLELERDRVGNINLSTIISVTEF